MAGPRPGPWDLWPCGQEACGRSGEQRRSTTTQEATWACPCGPQADRWWSYPHGPGVGAVRLAGVLRDAEGGGDQGQT